MIRAQRCQPLCVPKKICIYIWNYRLFCLILPTKDESRNFWKKHNDDFKTIINSIHPAIPAGHYGGRIRTATC